MTTQATQNALEIARLQDKIVTLILERDEWKESAVKLAEKAGDLSERLNVTEEALEALYASFAHNENTKGNKAKTDIIRLCPDVRQALNIAFSAREALKAYKK